MIKTNKIHNEEEQKVEFTLKVNIHTLENDLKDLERTERKGMV